MIMYMLKNINLTKFCQDRERERARKILVRKLF